MLFGEKTCKLRRTFLYHGRAIVLRIFHQGDSESSGHSDSPQRTLLSYFNLPSLDTRSWIVLYLNLSSWPLMSLIPAGQEDFQPASSSERPKMEPGHVLLTKLLSKKYCILDGSMETGFLLDRNNTWLILRLKGFTTYHDDVITLCYHFTGFCLVIL